MEGNDCSLLRMFCCSEFAWGVGRNLQKFRNELSKLSGRESKTGPAKIQIMIVTMPLFWALYYGVYLKSVLPTVVILLTACNQQPCVQTTCLAYVPEKLSILTAFSLSVLLVFERLWDHEPPLLALVPSVREIEQACDITMSLCFVSLPMWLRFIFQPGDQGSRN
jgi:hypothetical protein